jgi:hypothetical protein
MRVIRSKKGNLLLIPIEKGKNHGGKWSAGQPLFVLKKSVNIPARPFMRPAAKADGPFMRKAFAEFAAKAKAEIKQGVTA